MKTRSSSGQVVEEEAEDPVTERVDGDDGEQLRIVCNAVDREVESRSAAIVAIGDSHMASATAQLQLMMSRFPEHVLKMPMKKFLRQHCPNTKARRTRSNRTLCFDLLQDPAFQPPGEGTLDNWSAVIPTRDYTPMTEKIYPEMLPLQTGSVSGSETM